MKKILGSLILFCLFFIGGCTSAPKITPVQRTQMRTKTVDADYNVAFKAVMTVLENQGYTIENTDTNSGLIKAISVRDEAPAFSKAFGQSLTTTVDVSSTLTKISDNATRVRINIREKTDGSYGYTRSSSAKDIDVPEIYKTLFDEVNLEIARIKAMN